MALSFLGIYPLECFIDKRKLQFFGQLCRLECIKTIKDVFVYRLYSFLSEPQKIIGFIPDVYRILRKYRLENFLDTYLESATFPSKLKWKKSINTAIFDHVNNCFERKQLLDGSLKLMHIIHNTYEPCLLWKFSQIYRNQTRYCITAISIASKLFSLKYPSVCQLCLITTDNIALHLAIYCSVKDRIRNTM